MTPKGGLGGIRTETGDSPNRAFRVRLPYILCWNRALAHAPATFCFRIALSPKTSLHCMLESCSRLGPGHILLQNRAFASARPYFIVRERSRLMLRQAEAEAEADAG